MDIHIYHHIEFLPDPRLDQVITLLRQVIAKEKKIMATLADLQNSVAAQTTVESSIVTLLDGIAQQLRDAQANNDPAAIQAVIDQIDSNTRAMSEAVTRNTPASGGGTSQPQVENDQPPPGQNTGLGDPSNQAGQPLP